jgi:alkylhydroperoxidase family enzyme
MSEERPSREEPRVAPVELEHATEAQRALLEPLAQRGRLWNVFKTLANHPQMMREWMPFATYILKDNTLPPRDREIAILRIGWLCRAEYEWAQHVVIGRKVGIGEQEFARIQAGPECAGWQPQEQALLRAVDELHAQACIAPATWEVLAQHYERRQLMDLVFTVGQYNLVSMALNTFGVQLDEGLVGFSK